jgi:phospholipase C
MSPSRISRRRFLQGAGATAGTAVLGGLGRLPAARAQAPALPPPDLSGIDHVVVLMMENRSFDHYLGWLPNADGQQKKLTYLDREGDPHSTHRLAPEFQGCEHPDPDHSYEGGRVEYNGGAAWTTCDRYFSAILAPTFPNRMYQHAGQTDRLDNALTLSTLPTIWDRLAAAGLEGRYYFNDAPFLALWGARYLPIARTFDDFLRDAATGTLPNVAFVEPRFISAELGTSNDDHPHADIRNGQAFMNLVYTAMTTSPAWPRTVFVINYDEWGGFFDHVPPPAGPIPEADQVAGNEDGLLGFRVPCVVVSPFARREHVSHLLLDHTSVLRMIEWRWGLEPLTVRDAGATNLAEALDFSAPRLRAPRFRVPVGPFGELCLPLTARRAMLDDWTELRAQADAFGWPR